MSESSDIPRGNIVKRRDFLKLTAFGAAAAAVAAFLPGSNGENQTLPKNETLPTVESGRFLLNQEITDAEIEAAKKMFTRISLGVVGLKTSPNLLPEEYDKISDFDNNVFVQNMNEYVGRLVRLQTLHRQFIADILTEEGIKQEALTLIQANFEKLALPVNMFLDISDENPELSNKDLAFKLLFEAKDLEDEGVPIDPLIGMQVYESIGVQPWFSDFEYKEIEGEKVAIYPFTKRFLEKSGILFKSLSDSTGPAHQSGDLPSERPERFRFGSSEDPDAYKDHANGRYRLVTIDPEVRRKIIDELVDSGVDRSFATLAVRFDDESPSFGGGVIDSLMENKIIVDTDTIDKEFYEKYRKQIIFAIKHEAFHLLVSNIEKMSDFDAYSTYARLNLMYRETCNLSGDGEIPNEGHLFTEATYNPWEYFESSLNRVNESNRNRYAAQFIIYDIEGLNFENKLLQMYRSHLFPGNDFLKSSLFQADYGKDTGYENLPYEEKVKFARKSLGSLVEDLKVAYSERGDSMTNVEQFLVQEIIERDKSNGLFSELFFWYAGSDTNTYINTYLPGLIIRFSILGGDKRFETAVLKDVKQRLGDGVISPERASFIERMIKHHVNSINDNDRGTLPLVIEEYLADQFALSLTNDLGFDPHNPLSSLKSHSIIRSLRKPFKDLLEFFKQRNLALMPAQADQV